MLKILCAALIVFSASGQHIADTSQLVDEQMEACGAYELEDALPDYADDALDKIGVDLNEGTAPDFEGIMEVISEMASDSLRTPFSVCLSALGIIVLCSLAKYILQNRSDGIGQAFDTASAAAAIICVGLSAAEFIRTTAQGLEYICRFGSVLIPVMSVIASAGGHSASASSCSWITLAVMESVSLGVSCFIVPVLKILLGISLIAPLCEWFDFGKLTSSVEKLAKWAIGLAAGVISGAIAISSVASSAADGVSTRAARFLISGTVPVVGGVLSDAIGTISNCLGIVRGTVGAFGIIASLFIFLPPAMIAFMWMLGLNCLSWTASALGAERPAAAMRSLSSVASICLGLLAFVAMILICSAAIIMSLRSV